MTCLWYTSLPIGPQGIFPRRQDGASSESHAVLISGHKVGNESWKVVRPGSCDPQEEPHWQEASQFTRELALQREVEIDVQTVRGSATPKLIMLSDPPLMHYHMNRDVMGHSTEGYICMQSLCKKWS